MYPWGIQSSRSTSSERFILEVMVEKMRRFCRLSGMGNSIFRSNLPGRRRAGSSVSDRLVAMITYVCTCLVREDGEGAMRRRHSHIHNCMSTSQAHTSAHSLNV